MMRYKMDIMDAKRETREVTRRETRQEDIYKSVKMLRKLHHANDDIKNAICDEYNLSAEEARVYLK